MTKIEELSDAMTTDEVLEALGRDPKTSDENLELIVEAVLEIRRLKARVAALEAKP